LIEASPSINTMTATISFMPRRQPSVPRQRGLVLMLVLIVLGILALAGAAVMRSVDTGNTIAGNHSFQQGAMHASEQALAASMAFVRARVEAGNGNTTAQNVYYATRQVEDPRGFPAVIDWDAVACVDERGVVATGSCTDNDGRYKVQFVVERLCTANPAAGSVQNLRAVCEHDVDAFGPPIVDPETIPVHYRVIVRVRGPRNSDNWYEALIAGPGV
jgi:type IV pilus assembly protein PilX